MSVAAEPTPDRTIGGLAPRRSTFDASRLIAANRLTAPSTPTAPNPEGALPSIEGPRRPPASAGQEKTEHRNPGNAELKVKSSFYLRESTQNRARAAFRATAHLEDDETYSDFAEKAILAEVKRREALYNKGQQYSGGAKRLAPGRRVQ
jgi:hypothetical protein